MPKEINADQEREGRWIIQTRQVSPNENGFVKSALDQFRN